MKQHSKSMFFLMFMLGLLTLLVGAQAVAGLVTKVRIQQEYRSTISAEQVEDFIRSLDQELAEFRGELDWMIDENNNLVVFEQPMDEVVGTVEVDNVPILYGITTSETTFNQ